MRNARRTLIGLGLLALIGVGFGLRGHESAADDAPNAGQAEAVRKLIGTWKLEQSETPGTPSGIGRRLKMFTGTHWCVVQPDGSGRLVFVHGGTYKFDGTRIETKTDFAGTQTEGFIGSTRKFTLEVQGDTLRQVDPQGIFNETWGRVK